MTMRLVRVYQQPLSAKVAYSMSSSNVATPQSTVVEIVDDAGASGFGEVCLASPTFQPAHAAGVRASLEVLAPTILGLDPSRFSTVNAAMHRAMLGNNEGKAALDIACWDLAGKRLGRSVVDMLGGPQVEQILTYHVIGIGDPDWAAGEAERLQAEGITRIQLKAGGRHIDLDIDSIRAVAATINAGTSLDVDANRGWTTAEAILVSRACRDLAISLEQPCATEAELLHIKPSLNHPLIIDEVATDLPAIARQVSTGLANGFGLKISRLGGLTTMRAVRDLCMAARIPMSADDAWGSDIIAAACAAVGATLQPGLTRGAWIAHPWHQHHYDQANGPEIVDGFVTLPADGPGLGLSIDPAQFGEPVAVYGS